MNYADVQQDTRMDIQTVGVEMNDYLQRKIRNLVEKLKKAFPEANMIDIYLKNNDDSLRQRSVVVRFGIPGPDVVASDTGSRWKILLKNVEKKLIRQLEKRKAFSKTQQSNKGA